MEKFSLEGILSNAMKPMPIMELSAIWLPNAIITSKGKKQRIAPGDYVLIEGKKLVSMDGPEQYPTHCILKCRGTATSDFSIDVVDITTGKEKTIQIP